jgi:hypothetical protein
MSWWEWFFNTTAGAASLISLILGGILGVVSWRISRSTDKLITQSYTETRTLIAEGDARTQDILARMDERTARMNELAEERHREVIQAIQALKG